MSMLSLILLIISLLTAGYFRFSVLSALSGISEKAHLFCISRIPTESHYFSELSALVCAKNFSTLSESKLYLASGLIHLFVVSGAHLILIEQIFLFIASSWPHARLCLFLLLAAYAFMCGLNAPICRALVSYALTAYLSSKNIQWPVSYRCLITGLITMNLNPAWVTSMSLQLSWMAAFATSLTTAFHKQGLVLIKQFIFFVLLLPALIFLQQPSLTTVLMNLFLAPVLEFVLFPLALLTWFLNPFYLLFDPVLTFFQRILIWSELRYQPPLDTAPVSWSLWIWGFILLLHFLHHFYEYRKRRSL